MTLESENKKLSTACGMDNNTIYILKGGKENVLATCGPQAKGL
jgi:DNA-binding Xre family transcriptional regulator